MAVKTGRDVALIHSAYCCNKNMFQEVWGPEEGRADGGVPHDVGTGSVFIFCTESLILSKSGQVWGKKNAELLGGRVLQGRMF